MFLLAFVIQLIQLSLQLTFIIMKITKDISIEDLVSEVPESVKYLMDEGIRCVACGEPIWGTLEEAVLEKGYSKDDLKKYVSELQILANASN